MNCFPKTLVDRCRSKISVFRRGRDEADPQADAEEQAWEGPFSDDLGEEAYCICLDHQRGYNELDQGVLTRTWIKLSKFDYGGFYLPAAKQRVIQALCNPQCRVSRLALDMCTADGREWDQFCGYIVAKAVRRKDSTIRELELYGVFIKGSLIEQVTSALIDPNCNVTSLMIEGNAGIQLSKSDAFLAMLRNPQCKLRHVALDTMREYTPCRQHRLFHVLECSGLMLESLSLSVKGATHEELDPLVALFRSRARTLKSFKLTQFYPDQKNKGLTLWQPYAEAHRLASEMMGESMFAQLSRLLLDPINRLERLQLDIAYYFISFDSLLLGITSPFNNLRVFALDAGEAAFDKMPFDIVTAVADWLTRPENKLEDLRLSLQTFPEDWWQPVLDALVSPNNRLVRLHIDHWLSIEGESGRSLLPTYMYLAQSLGSPNNKLRHLRFPYLKALNGPEQFRRALFRSNLSSFWSSLQPTHGPQMREDRAFDLFLTQRWLQVALTLTSIACVPKLAENALCKDMPMMDFIRIIAHTLGWIQLMNIEPYLRG